MSTSNPSPHTLSLFLFFLALLSLFPSQAHSQSPSPITTPLKNKLNKGYYMTIQIGDPSKNNLFEMLLDISTPWTWVPDKDCFNCFRTNLRSKYYDCTLNNATCLQNQSDGIQNLSYPFGSIFAVSGYDQTRLEGFPLNTTFNTSMAFTYKVTEEFYNMDADGIIGLGPQADNEDFKPLVDLLYNQGLIANKTFSLFLTNNLRGEDSESQLIFGGYNPAKVAPNQQFQISPLSVSSDNFWTLTLNGIKIGDAEPEVGPVDVILSTTFQEIGVPQKDLDTIVEKIKDVGIICSLTESSTNYLCPCQGGVASFPDMELQFQNATLRVPSHVYITAWKSEPEDHGHIKVKEYNDCMLKFRSIDNADGNQRVGGNWILGRTVLSYYHTAFDLGNRTVAFAVANSPNMKQDFSFAWAFWMLGFAVIFLSIVCVLTAYKFMYIRHKAKKDKEDSKANEYHTI